VLSNLPAPELVWGLIPRFIGLIYMIAFGAIAQQLPGLIGSRGLGSVQRRLEHAKRDFPGLRRFFDVPTVFWLWNSDTAVRMVPWIGVAVGAFCVYGGPYAFYAHALAWLLWLSLEPAVLIFPWDTMLQEAGFLALFLPAVEPLPDLQASALPWPSVAFLFRWFVLRLMLGFAKVKFIGTTKQDILYLRGFFVWAPSPTPLAWFAHHLPAGVLRLMLYFMFVAEAIAPLLGLFAGPLRLVSFALLFGLMIGIQATGNWGFFNIGYVLLMTCLLDVDSSIFDLASEPWATRFWEWPSLALHAALVPMFLVSVLYLVLSESWTTRTSVHWPLDRYTWNRRWLRAILAFLRALAPFRIINGYGVFPPQSVAPLRYGMLFEGSHDGVSWKAYGLRHMPTRPHDRARIIAPYHPRIDMATIYAGDCMFDASFFGSMIGDGTPYACYTRTSWLERLCQRIMEREPSVMRLIGADPFPDGPPRLMRVSLTGMTPTHPNVRRATGELWHVQRLGVIVPACEKDSFAEDVSIPEPEVFHPDWVGYKRRSAPLRALQAAFEAGADPDQAVLAHSDLTAEDVRLFWQEFVPAARRNGQDFVLFPARAAELAERFGRRQLVRFERVLERFAWLLRVRTERHQFADAEPKLPIESNFRYHMFLQELVMDGAQAYRAYLGSVERVVERLATSNDPDQIWALAMLRPTQMAAHVLFMRWSTTNPELLAQIPGIFEYHAVLSKCVLEQEEFAIDFVKLPDGEYTIAGLYPPPASPSVSPG
jgi:Lipase maturation factor